MPGPDFSRSEGSSTACFSKRIIIVGGVDQHHVGDHEIVLEEAHAVNLHFGIGGQQCLLHD